MASLRRANDIRTRRSKMKAKLKAKRLNGVTVLLDPPEYARTMKVFDLLLAIPMIGRVKANRFLNACQISPSKTLEGLTERQRTELKARL